MNETLKKQISEEFDKIWGEHLKKTSMAKELKSFLFSTIEEVLEEKVEKIRKRKRDIKGIHSICDTDFNQALQKAIEIIKK